MSVQNLKISTKLFIAPMIFVASLIVLGVVAYVGLKDTQSTMVDLHKQDTQKIGAALRFQRDLQAFNGGLFRLISETTAGVDEEKLAKERETDLATLAKLTDAFNGAVENGRFTEAELEILTKAQKELKSYSVAAAEVIEMTELDTSTSVIMMVDTDQQFRTMYKTLDEMTALWSAAGEASMAHAVSTVDNTVITFIIIAAIALAISGAVSYATMRMITRPIGGITQVMAKLAEGDNTVEIDAQDRKDEIGEMARAVQVFKDNALERQRLEADAKRAAEERAEHERLELERNAKREADERAREQAENAAKQARAEKISNLIMTFEGRVQEVMETVIRAVRELQDTANSMTATAGMSQELAEAVAMASGEASANVQTVASAAEELTSSINEISRQVQQANNVSEQAVTEAANSTSSVSRLAETAKKISDVVNMINDIAGQTNLLALNATIEAARAGEAGKGFAVVASEVKSLATQTARATEEIGGQINDMQTATEEAVSAIGNIDGVINTIRESTVSISSAIEEQSAATNEISRNVQEASGGTTQVSAKIGEVSAKAGETGAAASQVLAASTRLEELSGNLRSDIETFLKEVRAA
ncbi:HAMP domain-containing protein [Sneathiella chungangensis]|uniref:HAMP domain-containing protein n=1 Tax=Sneathiella chungangensis TaxID=1418234 RepID=A0A845MGY3_9PROT|nr:methyl-accepting chemotaxis protein [Sneathiella chungangensis]MZR22902.1 HAMP domain-containing protein [Sneathiella chungangensis]